MISGNSTNSTSIRISTPQYIYPPTDSGILSDLENDSQPDFAVERKEEGSQILQSDQIVIHL